MLHATAGSGACANEAQVARHFPHIRALVIAGSCSVVTISALFVLTGGVHEFLNFFLRYDVVPLTCGTVHVVRIIH